MAAAVHDLDQLAAMAARPWRSELADLGIDVPAPTDLADPDPLLAPLADALLSDRPSEALLADLLELLRATGVGPLARYRVFRWRDGVLEGVVRPTAGVSLVGLDRELDRLHADVEAFLEGLPASDVLLYGPRGSGKSTAVRSLPERYGDRGLRLIELPAERLIELPQLLDALRDGVDRYIVFVDDLSFEEGDLRYRPLKSLLDGTVSARPDRVLLAATSNRRHLIRERFSDRPDPLNDDVHRWDTQHERLALADRFGLTITFPGADQRGYLDVVRGLVADEQPDLEIDEGLLRRAILFADRQSGYSGRTARHFVDALVSGRA
jgi:predicted AAA+ superfamily ATPase